MLLVTDIHARILALLDQIHSPYRVHEHPPVRTIDEARVLAPHLLEGLVKTIAFELDGASRVVLAAVTLDAQVDYAALARCVGVNRRALRLLPAARVEAELGFEVGGLGPFALDARTEVVLDEAVLAQPWLRCGAGLRTRTLELAAEDARRASNARTASIAKRATTSPD